MVSRVYMQISGDTLLIQPIGPEQTIKTLLKFGKPVPDSLRAAADNSVTVQADVTGTEPAVPGDAYDSSYLSPVTVGSKTLHLDFDTGSSDL
jgi:hypothetical protein